MSWGTSRKTFDLPSLVLCEWGSVSSNYQLSKMICCTVHICAVSLQCELKGESSEFQLDQKICQIEHICATFLQNATTNAWQECWPLEMTQDILCKNDLCQPSRFLPNLLTCFQQWLTMTEDLLNIFFLFSLTLWPLSLSGRIYLFFREGCKEEKNIFWNCLDQPIFGSKNALWV